MQNAQEDVLSEETGTCLNESAKKDDLRVIDVIGGHGPWQFRHWAIFFLATLTCSMHLFSTLPLMDLSFCQCANSTGNEKINLTQSSSCHILNCSVGKDPYLWRELSNPCFSPFQTTTLEDAEEESSKCSNAGVVIYAKCLFALGSVISSFAVYPIMKRFGRRSVSLTSCFLLLSCSLAGIWAIATGPYLVLKFVLSMGIVSVYLIAAFSLTDCVSEEFRLLYLYTGHISWGLAHFILPLFMWIIPSWTIFNVILTIPCCLLLVILCFLPETAESYASRGLWTRAHKVMRNAARCNGLSLQAVEQFSPNLILQYPKEDCDSDFTCHLKNYPCFLKHAALFIMGFLSSFIYFTSMWLTDWLQYKRGPYFSLLGTTEVAAVFVILFFAYFIPARRLWAVTSCMSSIFLIIMYTKETKEVPKLSRSTFITQMFFASASWTLLLLHVLSQPLTTKKIKCKVLITGVGLCFGLLGASVADIHKLVTWNRSLLLILAVPNLVIGACIGLISSKYFDGFNS